MLTCILVALALALIIPTLIIVANAAPLIQWARGPNRWINLCAFLARHATVLSDRLVAIKPLPGWTNIPLFLFGCAVWVFAISLNWFADSRTYVSVCLVLFAGTFGVLFYRVHVEQDTQGDADQS